MLRTKILALSRRVFASVFLSAGVLAVASLDMTWQENRHSDDLAIARVAKARQVLDRKLTHQRKAAVESPLAKLHESFSRDEIGETNPFTSLSTLDPIDQILALGVGRFTRQTFRSPDYREESGYDIVHYEIEHKDGTHSSILAYLDRPSLTSAFNVGGPDERVAHVLVLSAGGSYASFRAGVLTENAEISPADAQALLAQRLSAGIPFLSVAR